MRELCDRRRCGGATAAYHAAVLKPRLALTHGGGLSEETCRRLTLAATVLGSSMAYVTAINVAVPAIGADLDIDLGGQQWVLLSYSLALASLYLVAGALGDRLGRRKTFMIGTTAFAAASALGGVAPSAAVLIVARVLQGAAGALLTTGSLFLVRSTSLRTWAVASPLRFGRRSIRSRSALPPHLHDGKVVL